MPGAACQSKDAPTPPPHGRSRAQTYRPTCPGLLRDPGHPPRPEDATSPAGRHRHRRSGSRHHQRRAAAPRYCPGPAIRIGQRIEARTARRRRRSLAGRSSAWHEGRAATSASDSPIRRPGDVPAHTARPSGRTMTVAVRTAAEPTGPVGWPASGRRWRSIDPEQPVSRDAAPWTRLIVSDSIGDAALPDAAAGAVLRRCADPGGDWRLRRGQLHRVATHAPNGHSGSARRAARSSGTAGGVRLDATDCGGVSSWASAAPCSASRLLSTLLYAVKPVRISGRNSRASCRFSG